MDLATIGTITVLLAAALLRLDYVTAIPLRDFYPYGVINGDQALPKSNDGSSPAIQLEVPFRFFSRERSTIYVNNNGVISFNTSTTASAPQSLPKAGDRFELIAPFWSDVDTRVGNGSVFYRQTNASELLQRAGAQIQGAFAEFHDYRPTLLLIATWDHVRSHRQQPETSTATNTYQCVLATNRTASFALFLFADNLMEWIISDIEGAHPALVGFNSGDGVTSLTLPTSRTDHVLNITTSSNIQSPGTWLFRTDSSDIKMPRAIVGMEEVQYRVNEGDGPAIVCVSLLGELRSNVVVTLETGDLAGDKGATAGTDYTRTSHDFTFTPSTSSPLCISVALDDDTIVEYNETFSVSLRTSSSSVTLLPTNATVTILDDDYVEARHFRPVNKATEENGPVQICISLAKSVERDVPVTLTPISGTAKANLDFNSTPLELVMSPSDRSLIKCGSISLINDNIYEVEETFFVNLSSSDPHVNVPVPIARVEIVDMDASGVRVGFEQSSYTVHETNSSVTICVGMSGFEIGQPIVVTVHTSSNRFALRGNDLLRATEGDDYTSFRRNLTFNPEDRLTPRCTSTAIMNDTLYEGTESFPVVLKVNHSVTITTDNTRVDIIDDDVLYVSLTETEFTVEEDDLSGVEVCANLTGEFEREVELTLTPTPGTAKGTFDYISNQVPITFNPESSVHSQVACASISIVNDFALELQPETFMVRLSSPSPSIMITGQPSATISIRDDDTVRVSFSQASSIRPTSYSLGEDSTGPLRVCLQLVVGSLEIPVSVTVSTQNGTALAGLDYVSTTRELTFQPSTTSVCGNMGRVVKDDIIVEGPESFFLLLSSQNDRVHIQNQDRAQVTIEDDDVVNVNFMTANNRVEEGVGNVEVCAQMAGLNVRDVLVNMTTSNGTAKRNVDYSGDSFQLVFPSDPTSINQYLANNAIPLPVSTQCANITILDNTILGQNSVKTFTVSLSSENSSVTITNPETSTVEVIDNDVVMVGLNSTEHVVSEDVRSVSICAVLTGEADFQIQASLRAVDGTAKAGSDYDSLQSTVHFPPGTTGPQCIPVSITDDSVLEDHLQFFQVELSILTNANGQVRLGNNSTATITIQDNDMVNVSFQQASYSLSEAASTPLTVCLQLAGSLEIPVSVTLSTQNGTALAGFDYVPTPTELTFQPGTISVCGSVGEVKDDIIVEGAEFFSLLLSSQNNRVLIQQNTAQVTIEDNDVLTVKFISTHYRVEEGDGSVEVCAQMVGLNSKKVVINMSTNASTAKRNVKYVGDSFQLVFPSNRAVINQYLANTTMPLPESTQCANITILDNTVVEQDSVKTFTVSLSSENSSVMITGPETSAVEVIDNDVVMVGLNSTEHVVSEDVRSVSICAVLTGEADFQIQASLRTVDGTAKAGSDYDSLQSTVHFPPGTTGPQCIPVSITDDSVLEDLLQSFQVELSVLTNASGRVQLSNNHVATITIQDNDMANVSFQQASYSLSEAASTPLTVCLQLAGSLEIPVSVTLSTQNGTALAGFDYVPMPTELTFQPGTISVCGSVGEVKDDVIVEGAESFSLLLSSQNNRVLIRQNTAQVTIEDNDGLAVNFVATHYRVEEGDGSVEVCARMVGLNTKDVVINVSTNDGTAKRNVEYVGDSFQLVFSTNPAIISQYQANNTMPLPVSTQCASITILDNTVVEQDSIRTFTISLSSENSSSVTITNPETSTVEVINNDVVMVGLNSTEHVVSEDVQSVSICAVLTGEADFQIQASLHTVDGTAKAGNDYDSLQSTVHFPPGTTGPQCIPVSITDDSVLEDLLQSFQVELSVLTNASGRVQLSNNHVATIIIQDNDMVSVSFQQASYSLSEAASTQLIVCLQLVGSLEIPVSVSLSTRNGTALAGLDFAPMTTELTFQPGNTSVCGSVGEVKDDVIVEGAEFFSLLLSSQNNRVLIQQNTAQVTIEDNDVLTVNFISTRYHVEEGDGSVEVCAQMVGLNAKDVAINVSTNDGTAKRNVKYIGDSFQLVFLSNPTIISRYQANNTIPLPVSTQCANITILDNTVVEQDSIRTFTVSLSSENSSSVTITNPETSTVEVIDNDVVMVGLNSTEHVVSEDVQSVSICAVLTGEADFQIQASLRTVDGTAKAGNDYDSLQSTVHFPPGTTGPQCIPVSITDDSVLEDLLQSFQVELSVLTNASGRVQLSNNHVATIIIQDNDMVSVSFQQASYSLSEAASTQLTVCLQLVGSLEIPVSVSLSTQNGTALAGFDFAPMTTELTFQPGNTSVCGSVGEVKDDVIVEGAEFFSLLLSSQNNRVLIQQNTAQVTIEDNDVLTVNFISTRYHVEEGDGSVEVCARMVGLNAKDVAINVSTNDGTAKRNVKYIGDSFQLVFLSNPTIISRYQANNTMPLPESTQCANITILDNTVVEQDLIKTFTVSLSSENSSVTITNPETSTVEVIDNDVVMVGLNSTEHVVSEDVQSVSICAVLTGEADFQIQASLHTVDGTAKAGSDYDSLQSTVHFPPGTTGPQCIPVSITDDSVLEDFLQSFQVELSVLTNASGRVQLSNNHAATITIQDNDNVRVGLQQPSYTVVEGEGLVEVCVELSGLIERRVSVNVSTVPISEALANIDYGEMSATLVYQPSQAVTQLRCQRIPILNDSVLENTESFGIVITTPDTSVVLTQSRVPVYIQDDDGVRVSLERREYSIREGEGALTVCTTLDGAIEREVQMVLNLVPITAQANLDYVNTSVVIIYESQHDTKCANITILDDTIYETVETFMITISVAHQAVSMHIGNATVSIHDNDHVTIGFNQDTYTVAEGAGAASVCIDLIGQTERNVPIVVRTTPLTAQGNRDYENDDVRIHFSPSQSMTQTLCARIPIERDTILEHHEEFRAHLSSPVHRVTVRRNLARVMILDDDIITVSFGASEYSVSEDREGVEVCVVLRGTLEREVLINVTTTSGTADANDDFVPVTFNFTFDSNITSQCFNISIIDDLLVEKSEKFRVSLSTTDTSVSFVPPSVDVTITDEDIVCPTNTTINLYYGNYTWIEVTPNNEVMLPCKFGEAQPGGRVTRLCGPDGTWEVPRVLECNINAEVVIDIILSSPFDKDVLRLLSIAVAQVTKAGTATIKYTTVIDKVFSEFAKVVADNSVTADKQSFTYVMEIVNNIQKWNPDLLKEHSSRIVNSVEAISMELVREDNFADYKHFADELGFKAEMVGGEKLKMGVDRSFYFGDGTLNVTSESAGTIKTLDKGQVGRIFLPSSLFTRPNMGLFFSLYSTPVLFPLANGSREFDTIASPVIAATVTGGEAITNLSEPITILLQFDPKRENYSDVRCVSWDFNAANNLGNWTTDGCTMESEENGVVNCSCTHLTNFAFLVDVRPQVDLVRPRVTFSLDLMSIIAIGVSLLGLVLTIITLLAFRKLRQRDSSKFLFQLCISMSFMMVAFLVGIGRTEIFYVCAAVASLIHYFTLVSVMWMGAMALLMFQKLIFAFEKASFKYVLLVSLVSWLLPIPAVVVPPAINTNFTVGDNPEFCFITHMYVFFGAFIGPIFLVLVFTLIMFMATLIGILCHSRKSLKEPKKAAKRKGTVRMMFSLFGVIVLFGGSWVFAVFTVNGAPVTVTFVDGTLELFHLLFVVFTSLQGLFIFLVFVLFSKEARELWLRIFCCRKKQVTPPSSILGTPTKTQSEMELDNLDDKKDVEAAEEVELTDTGVLYVNNQSGFSTLLQQPSDEQLHTQPAILHSRSDSGIAADQPNCNSSPGSIKREVERIAHTTVRDEASSSELLYNADITTGSSQDHGISQLATVGSVVEDRGMDAETLSTQDIATTKHVNGAHELEQQLNDVCISEQQLNDARVSEQQLNGAHESEQQLNGVHSSEQQLNGIHTSEQQLNGAHESEQQLNGIHTSEQHLNGVHESEQQLNGAHTSEQQLNGIHTSEQQLNSIHTSEQQLNGAHMSEQQLNGGAHEFEQLNGAHGSNYCDQDQRELNAESSYAQDAATTEHQSNGLRESSYTLEDYREENQTNSSHAWTSNHTTAADRPDSRESISDYITAAKRPDSCESRSDHANRPDSQESIHSKSFSPSGRQNTHWVRSQCKWIPDDELDEDMNTSLF